MNLDDCQHRGPKDVRQAAWQLAKEYAVAVPTWSTEPDEGDHDTTVRKSYLYGNYIDEVLAMRDHGSGEGYFYDQNDLFSVYAVTDDAGDVVERYEYGDYGQVTVLDASGALRDPDSDGQSESIHGNRHTFTGRLLDEELTLDDGSRVLQYRNRYIVASTGLALHRDPLGYVDSMNLYIMLMAAPLSRVDPYGLSCDYMPYRKCHDLCDYPWSPGNNRSVADCERWSECVSVCKLGRDNECRAAYKASLKASCEGVSINPPGIRRRATEALMGCNSSPNPGITPQDCSGDCFDCVAALASYGFACTEGLLTGPPGWALCIMAYIATNKILPYQCVDCLACAKGELP